VGKVPYIIPVSDLRQEAAAILKRVQDSSDPVVVTQRGRPAAVLIGVAEFERGEREREILWTLLRGQQDIAAGRTVDLEDALAELDSLFPEAAP
jgi:prevent-host-death family protein